MLGVVHLQRVLRSRQMKKSDLAKAAAKQAMAKQNGVNPGTAADEMDRVVNRIIRALRGGKPARLPGLGTINPGKQWTFQQERREN
jgi:nucleoid DNA-binding protein